MTSLMGVSVVHNVDFIIIFLFFLFVFRKIKIKQADEPCQLGTFVMKYTNSIRTFNKQLKFT